MDKSSTKLDWVGFSAAQYACKHWHYSRSMPVAPVSVGIWHDGEFEGAIVYGKGAQQNLGTAFGLSMFRCVELCRVAMKPDHKTPVTRAVSISLKMLKKQSPGLRLIVSYADIDQGHHGGIYAGGNWVYIGMV